MLQLKLYKTMLQYSALASTAIGPKDVKYHCLVCWTLPALHIFLMLPSLSSNEDLTDLLQSEARRHCHWAQSVLILRSEDRCLVGLNYPHSLKVAPASRRFNCNAWMDLQVERTLKLSEVDDSSEELKSGLGSYAFMAWALLLAFRLIWR